MRKNQVVLIAGALALLGGCSKTDDGGLVVKKPVGVDVQTTTDTLHPPTITTRTDTVNTPVIGTKTDTIIVNKPVIGTKRTEVKVPTIKKP